MRILGVDLGSSSIKAVEIDSTFGRYDIHDYHERAHLPGDPPQKALSDLIRSLSKSPDKIVVSLPTYQTTFRNLQLPTRDKKAIQSGVGFELEDELPFPTESCAYEYAVLSQNKTGSTVHVAASLKSHIETDLASWRSGNLEPDVVTTEAWAYRILFDRILPPTEQHDPVLLVQMGHERTTLYLHWKGNPILIREARWGGRDLTLALCNQFNIPMDQAESLKIDQGFIGNPDHTNELTPQQNEFSAYLETALEELVNELRQAELIAKSVTEANIKTIYIGGGTSLLPGLQGWIEGRLNTPTKPLLALSSVTSSGVTYSEQTEARFQLATALALCLVGSDRAICINFRRGAFAKEGQTRELNLKAFKRPILGVAIVSFCLFLSLIVQSSVYQSRLATTDTQLEKSVRSFFGQLSTSALRTYMSNTSTLRASINKELNKQREITRLFGSNPHSPLDFLKTLSASIGKDIVVDMTKYQVGSPPNESYITGDPTPAASLTFLVSNPQVAEKLSVALGNRISSIQRGKMEEVSSPDGATKKWRMSFSGKPIEDAYGK